MEERKTTRRALQAEASKHRIYDAAMREFRERGFDRTGIQDICAQASCSVGAFYHHFGSKEGVLEETFRLVDEDFADFARNRLPLTGGGERVVEYFLYYAELVSERIGLDLSKHLYCPGNKLFIREGRSMQTALTGILREAAKKGELSLETDAAEACEWLFVGARGLVFHWCLREGDFDLKEAMRTYARRALRAIERR